MPYGIKNSKFFVAVKDFEASNFQTAFEKMLVCASVGNFYALYYLEYFLKNKQALKNLTAEQEKIAQELCELIPYIPKHGHPEAWLQASCTIIEVTKRRNQKKQLGTHVKQLRDLTQSAPNAMVYLVEHLEKMHAEDGKLKKIQFTVSENLLMMAYYIEHPDIPVSPYINKKYLTAIEQHANSKEIQKDGDLEFILGKELDERSWIIDAAYMGNQSARDTLTALPYPFPLIITSKEALESVEWLQLKARDHVNARIALALARSIKSDNNLKEKKHIQKELEDTLIQNREEALKTTAKEFLREAHYLLGSFYANEDNEQAKLFFERATEYESASAYAMLGKMYHFGYGVPINFKLAAEHYEKALALKKRLEQKGTICTIPPGFSVSENLANLYLSGDDSLEMDALKAFTVLKAGALTEKNPKYKVDCQIYSEFLRYFGKGIESDKKAAVETLQNLYLKGEENAAVVIAQVYFRAHAEKVALPNFKPEILQNSLKIAARNTPETFCKNVTAAKFERSVHLNYIKMAAEHYAEAARYYATETMSDLVVGKSPSRENKKLLKDCERFLNLAYKNQARDAASALGTYYFNINDKKNALHYYQEGMQKKEYSALRTMAEIYEEGSDTLGIKEDEERAFQLYSEMANSEDPEQSSHGLFQKARLLKSGYGKMKPDILAAKLIFEDLLKKEFLLAGIELADIYDRGFEGNPRDPNRVFEYLKIAEPTQSADVLNALGFCYRDAQGTLRDVKRAIEYFEKAAKLGHHTACVQYVTLKIRENIEEIKKDPARFKNELEAWQKFLEASGKLYGDTNLLNALIDLIQDPKAVKPAIQKLQAGHHCKHSHMLQKFLQQQPPPVINLEVIEQILTQGVETVLKKQNDAPAAKSTIARLEELGEELFQEKPSQLDLRKVNRYVSLLNLLRSEDEENSLEINARRRKGIFTAFQLHGQQHSFTWHPMHGKGRRNSVLLEPGPISHILQPLSEVHNQMMAAKKAPAAHSQ